jgi:hypothetical protein
MKKKNNACSYPEPPVFFMLKEMMKGCWGCGE